jgi:hypothetical protein
MERSAHRLLVLSLAGFAGVIGFGAIRASPAHALLDTAPAVIQAFQAFHAHFDSLVWLGAAALGGALKLLAPGYRGPAWAPRWLAPLYAAGTVLFAGSYAVKGLGLRLGLAALAQPLPAALASIGGVLLLAAAACALAIGRAVLAAPRAEEDGSGLRA